MQVIPVYSRFACEQIQYITS